MCQYSGEPSNPCVYCRCSHYICSYLGRYAIFLSMIAIFFSLSFLAFLIGSIRASRVLHEELMKSVFGTTLR